MELIEDPYVSTFTQKTLEQFGWKQGDPIPATLGDFFVTVKESLPPSSRTDVLIDKELMPEDAVREAENMLAEAKIVAAQLQRQQEKEKKLAQLNPAIAQQYAQVMSQLEVVDDREQNADDPAGVVATDEPPKEPAAVPAAAAASAAPAAPVAPNDAADTLDGVVPFCPRCGWDVRQKYESMPTERDKEDFLATLFGNTRFKKEYELFGGKLKVRFRGLLAEENKLIYRQLVLDQQENKIATEAEWFMQMLDYRLACSLEQMENGSGKVISIVPELFEQKNWADPARPLATPLPAQLDYINKHVLAQEVTRRLVGTHLRQFQRLVEALEAMALEPSFWTGIE